MRPLYVMRDSRPLQKTLVDKQHQVSWGDDTSHIATIVFSPIYDETLGEPLGQVTQWMREDDLRTWIEQRLGLLNLPPEYILIPPVGWGYN